jgi:hypothetical protein
MPGEMGVAQAMAPRGVPGVRQDGAGDLSGVPSGLSTGLRSGPMAWACRIPPGTCGNCRDRQLGMITIMRDVDARQTHACSMVVGCNLPCQSGIILGTSISRPSTLILIVFHRRRRGLWFQLLGDR